MSTLCPHCKGTIPDHVVAGKKSIECPFCAETVRVKQQPTPSDGHTFASLPENAQETPAAVPAMDGDVPPSSRIRVDRFGPREVHISLRGGNWAIGCIFIVFALFWNCFILGALATGGSSGPGLIFMLPFILVGLFILLVALFLIFGSGYVILQPETCTVQKKLSFLAYTRTLATAEINDVKYVESYRQNNRPVYGIGLCTGETSASFGASLKEDEKNWLLQFVRRTLDEVRKG